MAALFLGLWTLLLCNKVSSLELTLCESPEVASTGIISCTHKFGYVIRIDNATYDNAWHSVPPSSGVVSSCHRTYTVPSHQRCSQEGVKEFLADFCNCKKYCSVMASDEFFSEAKCLPYSSEMLLQYTEITYTCLGPLHPSFNCSWAVERECSCDEVLSEDGVSCYAATKLSITIRCLTNCDAKVIPTTPLNLMVECSNCDPGMTLTYVWEVDGDLDWAQDMASLNTSVALGVKENRLGPNATYIFTAHASDANCPQRSSDSVTYSVETASLPTGGVCTISPPEGTTLVTKFTITCVGFSDPDDSLIFRYYMIGDNAKLLATDTQATVGDIVLPSGEESSGYNLTIHTIATNMWGAAVSTSNVVQVYPVGYSSEEEVDITEYLRNLTLTEDTGASGLDQLVQAGDTQTALLSILGAAALLNEEAEKEDVQANATVLREDRVLFRTSMVSTLEEVEVTDISQAYQAAVAITEISAVAEDLTPLTQVETANVYNELGTFLSEAAKDETDNTTDASLAAETARFLLEGSMHLLETTAESVQTKLVEENLTETNLIQQQEDMKNTLWKQAEEVASNTLSVVESVSDILLEDHTPSSEPLSVYTQGMHLALWKNTVSELTQVEYTAKASEGQDEVDSGHVEKATVSLEGLEEDLMAAVALTSSNSSHPTSQLLHIQMYESQSNPFIWDDSAQEVTSSVVSVDVKTLQGTKLSLGQLQKPITINFPQLQVNDEDLPTTSSFQKNISAMTMANLTESDVLVHWFECVPGRAFRVNVFLSPNVALTTHVVVTIDKRPLIIDFKSSEAWTIQLNSTRIHRVQRREEGADPEADGEASPVLGVTVQSETGPDGDQFVSVFGHLGALEAENVTVYIGVLAAEVLDSKCGLDDGGLEEDCWETQEELVQLNCTIDVDIAKCLYWDVQLNQWRQAGCLATMQRSPFVISCACDHMTAFGGSFFVAPNKVDLIQDINLFSSFFTNPISVTLVLVVWVLYALLMVWARKKDRSDVEKLRVTVLEDNEAEFQYCYLLIVLTGWRNEAGTSSTIGVRLYGNKGSTSPHLLTDSEYKRFDAGDEDWFLMTTEQSLGDLQSLEVWHDCSGYFPTWYLNQISVRDVQTGVSWTFVCDAWLAPDRDDKLVHRVLRQTHHSQLQPLKYIFLTKSSQSMRDDHLWVSIFARPPASSFTRPQRVTCALTFLLSAMLANMMFYGTTDDPDDQYDIGQFTINIAQLMISIQSLFVTIPINFLIAMIFRKCDQRPRKDLALARKDGESVRSLELSHLSACRDRDSFKSIADIASNSFLSFETQKGSFDERTFTKEDSFKSIGEEQSFERLVSDETAEPNYFHLKVAEYVKYIISYALKSNILVELKKHRGTLYHDAIGEESRLDHRRGTLYHDAIGEESRLGHRRGTLYHDAIGEESRLDHRRGTLYHDAIGEESRLGHRRGTLYHDVIGEESRLGHRRGTLYHDAIGEESRLDHRSGTLYHDAIGEESRLGHRRGTLYHDAIGEESRLGHRSGTLYHDAIGEESRLDHRRGTLYHDVIGEESRLDHRRGTLYHDAIGEESRLGHRRGTLYHDAIGEESRLGHRRGTLYHDAIGEESRLDHRRGTLYHDVIGQESRLGHRRGTLYHDAIGEESRLDHRRGTLYHDVIGQESRLGHRRGTLYHEIIGEESRLGHRRGTLYHDVIGEESRLDHRRGTLYQDNLGDESRPDHSRETYQDDLGDESRPDHSRETCQDVLSDDSRPDHSKETLYQDDLGDESRPDHSRETLYQDDLGDESRPDHSRETLYQDDLGDESRPDHSRETYQDVLSDDSRPDHSRETLYQDDLGDESRPDHSRETLYQDDLGDESRQDQPRQTLTQLDLGVESGPNQSAEIYQESCVNPGKDIRQRLEHSGRPEDACGNDASDNQNETFPILKAISSHTLESWKDELDDFKEEDLVLGSLTQEFTALKEELTYFLNNEEQLRHQSTNSSKKVWESLISSRSLKPNDHRYSFCSVSSMYGMETNRTLNIETGGQKTRVPSEIDKRSYIEMLGGQAEMSEVPKVVVELPDDSYHTIAQTSQIQCMEYQDMSDNQRTPQKTEKLGVHFVDDVDRASDISGSHFHIHIGSDDTSIEDVNVTFDEESSVEIKPAIKKPKKRKSPFKLPGWCVYVAWLLAISTSIMSSYVVMLYGLKFGYGKSLQWLSSFFGTFFQSVAIIQPTKVAALALLAAYFLKAPVSPTQEVLTDNIPLAGDEEYTSMRMTSVPRGPLHGRDRRYRPPSQEVRESVCKRLHQEREMKRMMGTVAVYVVYLACVYVIVFSHQDPRAFLSLQSVTHCVVEPQYEGDLPLLEVSSVDDMWEYLETTLVPNLYVTTVDGEQFLPDMSSKVLGVARLRQLRVNQGACVYRPLHPSILWRDECFGSYTFESEDTSSYNVSWKQAMNQTACDELPLPWTYQADTGAAAFMGPSEKWYSGAGYVVELSRDADQSLQILHDLQAEHWADEYTRAVFVEFTTFQPSTELFTVILIMFESLPTGNVLPFYHMMNSKLFFYHTKDLELNNFIVELLYIILMVGFSYQELKRFMGLKWKDYVQNPWSWMELAVICLSYASVAMFAGRVMTVRWTLDRYVETGPDSFTSFYAAALSDYLLTYILGTLLMLLTMKLVQLLQFTRRVLLLTSALYLSTSAMLGLVLLIGMMFMVFTGIGLLLMQPYCANLARVQDVVGALVYLLLLESPYDPEECIGSHITEIIAPIYFFVVGFTMMILWFPFLEAILDYGVVHIRKTHKQHLKDQYELLDFLKIKINGIFHSDKSKKGRRLSRIQRRLSRF